jgi:hypothetical protein
MLFDDGVSNKDTEIIHPRHTRRIEAHDENHRINRWHELGIHGGILSDHQSGSEQKTWRTPFSQDFTVKCDDCGGVGTVHLPTGTLGDWQTLPFPRPCSQCEGDGKIDCFQCQGIGTG